MMELAALEKRLKQHDPDDVIAALLVHLPEEFLADPEAIHKTITDLARDYPELFGWCEVTSDYPYPFSRPLEIVLDRLRDCRWLGTWNPDFSVYRVDPESKAAIRKRIWALFSAEERKKLERAAERLAEATRLPERTE